MSRKEENHYSQVHMGPFHVDFRTQRVIKPDKSEAHLTVTQLRMLSCLEVGKYVETPELQRRMSIRNQYALGEEQDTLWVFMKREPKTIVSEVHIAVIVKEIREALGPTSILSRHGRGYMINPDVENKG